MISHDPKDLEAVMNSKKKDQPPSLFVNHKGTPCTNSSPFLAFSSNFYRYRAKRRKDTIVKSLKTEGI